MCEVWVSRVRGGDVFPMCALVQRLSLEADPTEPNLPQAQQRSGPFTDWVKNTVGKTICVRFCMILDFENSPVEREPGGVSALLTVPQSETCARPGSVEQTASGDDASAALKLRLLL